MNALADFHFLRPGWLWLLLPAALVWWRLLRSGAERRTWEKWVDKVLLDALLVPGGPKRRWRPVHLLGLFWLVGILALAGPAWQREASPFAEDQAALMMALRVAPSMQETDIAPTRQQRAAQKISDLLAARPGTRNGLLAYAGTAHLVMPLTTDGAVINSFAADLVPDLMPKPGDDVAAALALAARSFGQSGPPGAILFITDQLGQEAVKAFAEHRKNGGVPVHVWAATADPPPELAQAAKAGGGSYAAFTPDLSDAERLVRAVQQTATSAGASAGQRWRDAGYWLMPLLALMGALWFRKGWVVG